MNVGKHSKGQIWTSLKLPFLFISFLRFTFLFALIGCELISRNLSKSSWKTQKVCWIFFSGVRSSFQALALLKPEDNSWLSALLHCAHSLQISLSMELRGARAQPCFTRQGWVRPLTAVGTALGGMLFLRLLTRNLSEKRSKLLGSYPCQAVFLQLSLCKC